MLHFPERLEHVKAKASYLIVMGICAHYGLKLEGATHSELKLPHAK